MIAACRHGDDRTKPQPCPPMCPSQTWPRHLFTHSGKLKRQHRPYLDAWLAYDQNWRAYADQFPDGRYHGDGPPHPPPPMPSPPEATP